jgi:hypothetical protein
MHLARCLRWPQLNRTLTHRFVLPRQVVSPTNEIASSLDLTTSAEIDARRLSTRSVESGRNRELSTAASASLSLSAGLPAYLNTLGFGTGCFNLVSIKSVLWRTNKYHHASLSGYGLDANTSVLSLSIGSCSSNTMVQLGSIDESVAVQLTLPAIAPESFDSPVVHDIICPARSTKSFEVRSARSPRHNLLCEHKFSFCVCGGCIQVTCPVLSSSASTASVGTLSSKLAFAESLGTPGQVRITCRCVGTRGSIQDRRGI